MNNMIKKLVSIFTALACVVCVFCSSSCTETDKVAETSATETSVIESTSAIETSVIEATSVMEATSLIDYTKQPKQKAVVIACSDFQGSTDFSSAENVNRIGNRINEAGIEKADGFLFCGDFSLQLNNNPSDSESGIKALTNQITKSFGISTDKMVLGQGNHDPIGTKGSSPSGDNDPKSKAYGVFLINENDYMWQQGKNTTDGNVDVGDDAETVKATANKLKAYLDEKVQTKFNRPIFVLSHLPLHCSNRTEQGDNQYAKYIFDVLNEGAEQGLNIIFLFGHNHSQGYDNYLGGSCIFYKPGDSIFVSTKTKWDYMNSNLEYTKQKLKFTYMNAGYVGYFNPGEESAPDTSLTMTVFKIDGNSVVISRYDSHGIHNLKCSGSGTFKENYADTTVYESPITIK